MEAYNALTSHMEENKHLGFNVHAYEFGNENHTEHERDHIRPISYNSDRNTVSNTCNTDIKCVSNDGLHSIRDTDSYKHEINDDKINVIRMRAEATNRSQISSLASMLSEKHNPNDRFVYNHIKVTEEGGSKNRHHRLDNNRTRYPPTPDTLNFVDDEQCISTVYTIVALGFMLLALLVPAIFHVCCQFRLYGSLSQIYERMKNPETSKIGGAYIQKGAQVLVDHIREFENFFFIGIFLYLCIQIIGFYVTQTRIRFYLWRLCLLSVELSKHEFLYGSKQRAVEHFSDYGKRIYRGQPQACRQTEKSLVKAFDEASSKFDNYHVDDIWNRITFLRCRMMLLRIYIPIFIHAAISIGTAAFVYDRRFRMYHRVPLAHPDIISNLYWYAAIQYEGFWCILAMFMINIVTWLYLCNINRHKILFGLLEEAQSQIRAIILDFSNKLAKDIWDNQMLLFSSTIYAMDSNKSNHQASYAPVRLETLSSQINFGNIASSDIKRPCLCHFLCLPDMEDTTQDVPSFIGRSPFEELHIPLLEPGFQDTHRGDIV
ncbi:putative integral membrane protein [Babesia bovis T2Bo]|uniref:Uncharacterized protein n=1 Tax=Babesia bovis TaxID=5865 RepID=A7AW06_BABBO|nr:putative integral membrane protein [Babesia bovis T2Bo]EDO05234.1 putative integral membrane protein [Babesia bovis T2Bo]|eukprot:XP_001608802.1 hypothetical protein [Babesia bovis T2Bo]